jgi:hypothetical protein
MLHIMVERARRPGLVILTYAHDAWCPAAKTQRSDDCRCSPDVYLVEPFAGEKVRIA